MTGFEYTYDDLSNIVEEKVLANSTKLCYTYDSLNRVTSRTVKNLANNSVISSETYTYDAAGNLTDAPDSCFQYDTNNRLVVFNGNDVSYDLDGNMLSNGSLLCTYDSANRLIKAGDHAYTYNAEDVRIRNLCSDADTTYTYNTNCKLSQLLTKTTNDITTKYVYGIGLIGEEKCGEFKTYHFDYRGSTVAITDISGNITDTFKYDTYGKVTEHIGSSFVIFGYNGRDGVITDKNGLYYMRARYYSPDMRRFVNADIISGEISDSTSLNRYSYVNGNPVSFVDPFGLSKDERWQYSLDSFVENLQTLYNLASLYYGFNYKSIEQLNKAVMSCFTIERFYSGSFKKTFAANICSGTPDKGFIRFAKSQVGKRLDEYIFSPEAELIVGDIAIDIPHMMMTLSAIATGKITYIPTLTMMPTMVAMFPLYFAGNEILDDYTGWAGDLITLTKDAQNLVDGSGGSDVYTIVKDALKGEKESSLSPSDLFADMDASNMGKNVRFIPIHNLFSWYYGKNGNSKRRCELFIKNEFPFDIEGTSKKYLKFDNPLTSIFYDIFCPGCPKYSENTANEAARAFSDYLISQE